MKQKTNYPYTSHILAELERLYPDAKPALRFSSPYELLIATILSAQCTDNRVNQVTERLFACCNTPDAMLQLSREELISYIKPCGLFQMKSKNILETSKILQDTYGGTVPKERRQLEELPGVGRKTANVVLSNAFGIPAIAVDTHVFRVANRLGLAQAENVLNTEQQLMQCIPEQTWSVAHHWLIWHGRTVCRARRPDCGRCTLKNYCRYDQKTSK